MLHLTFTDLPFLGSPKKPEEPIVEHVPENYVSERKRLYLVQMGMGFLELPQIELKHGILNKDMLQTKNVYILDATSDIFLWIGKSASRMVKMAGQVWQQFYKMENLMII